MLLQITSPEGIDTIAKIAAKYGIRLFIDLVSTYILMQFIYFRFYKNKDLLFTYFVFNIVIFTISFLLNRVEISMGAAFGLFAVFSMLRYKTEEISIKDMTYLFLTIAIGIVSAVTRLKGVEDVYEYLFLVAIISSMILVALMLESNWFMKQEIFKTVYYEKIELIHPSKYNEFLEDLRSRTGIDIHRAEVQKIDFLRDTAQVKIYFYDLTR
ncbi:MAG: hypothetical protein RLZZ94_79 [Bacteroidota bacterium]|jgi:hypothetical protein